MALCVENTAGTLTATSTAPEDCTAYLLVDSVEYATLLETYPIEATDIAYVFSWGLGTIIFFWYLGFVIGVAKKAISKA
jgi:apolipoprotein N-acyltransferase